MKFEYTELSTMLDVAQAKARGEKIEVMAPGFDWVLWSQLNWNDNWRFRSIREVPVKKVKFEAWKSNVGGLLWSEENSPDTKQLTISSCWTRFPSADKEYEVEE